MVVQIHTGEIHPERQECIESVKKYYGNDDYRFYSDSAVEEMVQEMMADLQMQERPRRFDVNNLKGRVVISDWLRFWLASKEDDLLYIDTDVLVRERFEDFQRTGRPYMLQKRVKLADYCVIYSNGCREWFRKRLEERKEDPNVLLGAFSWVDVDQIPEKYMHHISSSGDEEHWQKNYWGW